MGQDGVAALRRNGWPESIGIGGRLRPEYPINIFVELNK